MTITLIMLLTIILLTNADTSRHCVFTQVTATASGGLVHGVPSPYERDISIYFRGSVMHGVMCKKRGTWPRREVRVGIGAHLRKSFQEDIRISLTVVRNVVIVWFSSGGGRRASKPASQQSKPAKPAGRQLRS